IGAMPVERQVGCAFRKAGRHYTADVGAGRHARNARDYVLPGLPAIARDLQVAVVSANVQQPLLQGRLGYRYDMAIGLLPIMAAEHMLIRKRSHDRHLVPVLVLAQIIAACPTVAPVGGLEHAISGEVDGVVVMRRNQNRRVPVKPVFLLARRRLRLDRSALVGPGLKPVSVPALRFCIDYSRVLRINLSVKPVAPTDSVPLIVGRSFDGQCAARPRPAPIVLETAIDPIWFLIVDADL